MPEFDKVFTLSKKEIALQQLNRSVSLFLVEKDFISSITLAGAAEEILGSYVRKSENDPCVVTQAKYLVSVGASNLSEKEITFNHLNLARNALKHFNISTEESISLALETEAIAIIVRAIENMRVLRIEFSREVNAFILWVKSERKDIADPEVGVEIVRP